MMDQKRRRRDSGSFKKGVVKVSIYAPHLKQFDKILEEDKAMYLQRVGNHVRHLALIIKVIHVHLSVIIK